MDNSHAYVPRRTPTDKSAVTDLGEGPPYFDSKKSQKEEKPAGQATPPPSPPPTPSRDLKQV